MGPGHDPDRPQLRLAAAADADALVGLLQELIATLAVPPPQAASLAEHLPEDIARALRRPGCRLFVAVASAAPPPQLVGLARADVLTGEPLFRMRAPYRCGYVDQMYVRAGWRRRGLGGQLLAACEDWFAQQGLTHCLLHGAPPAMSFYQRRGYQGTGQLVRCLQQHSAQR